MDFAENGRMKKDRVLREAKQSYIHDKLVPILKEKIPEVWKENVNHNLELYEEEEVGYCDGESYDGFMSTCEAGLDMYGWLPMSYLVGTGYRMGGDKIKKLIEDYENENYAMSQEALFKRYKDKIKDKGDDLLSDPSSYDFAHDDVPHIIAVALDLGGDDEENLRDELHDIEEDERYEVIDALLRVIFHKDDEDPTKHSVMIFSNVSFGESESYTVSDSNGEIMYSNEFTFSESDDPEEVANKILAEVATACKAI